MSDRAPSVGNLRQKECAIIGNIVLSLPGKAMKPSVIIDVRTPLEFVGRHLDGAINIPLDQLAGLPDALDGIEKSASILVYCQTGARSGIACSIMRERGYAHVTNGGSLSVLSMNFKTSAPFA